MAAAAGCVLLAFVLLQVVVVQVFSVREASMRPTLDDGDRVLVLRPLLDRAPRRGDVVVADVRGSWSTDPAPARAWRGSVLDRAPAESFVTKRVVAVAGERVTCCADGRLLVDGMPLEEPYLRASAGEQPYDVVVPPNRLWLLGDNRSASADSSTHLGSPGGGSLATSALVGRVVGVVG